MIICEHTISEYKLNGNELFSVTIVYKISSRGKELLAQLTVDPDAHKASVISIGTEWTDSAAEADRIRKLKQCAGNNVLKYVTTRKVDGNNSVYRHMDYRKSN